MSRRKRDSSNFLVDAVGKTRDPENSLSRLFVASFTASKAFADAVLKAIWRGAALQGKLATTVGWSCSYQQSTTKKGGGIVDILLQPPQFNPHGMKPIWLESKLGSRLGEAQLSKYKDHGARVLVAVTKNWPEVPPARLASIGVKQLRWQDVCRSLRGTGRLSQVDRFIFNSFTTYLEKHEMAFRENITAADLGAVRKLVNRISDRRSYTEIAPRDGFETAHDILDLFRDVKHIFLDKQPRFIGWRTWGPGYYRQLHNETSDHHVLGFGLFLRAWSKQHLLCGFMLPVAKDMPFQLYIRYLCNDLTKEKRFPIKRIASGGAIDAEKIATLLKATVAEWRLSPSKSS